MAMLAHKQGCKNREVNLEICAIWWDDLKFKNIPSGRIQGWRDVSATFLFDEASSAALMQQLAFSSSAALMQQLAFSSQVNARPGKSCSQKLSHLAFTFADGEEKVCVGSATRGSVKGHTACTCHRLKRTLDPI